MKLSCQPYVYYIYKQYAAAGACSARNLSRHFWAAYDNIHVNNTLPLAHEISKANEILSLSVKRENRLKLCQATWTTHGHSEKFNRMLKNFANFTRFSLLFSTKKVTGSLVKLSESIFKMFILCFQSYLCSFCTISSGLRVQFRHLLANHGKIYIHDVNIDASQADRALNWTARNQ